jgi:hypothetical protein
VDQAPLALPAAGDALAAPLARGKQRRQWRHTPTASARVPQPRPESALASRPMSHRSASAATTGASHSSRPTAAPVGHHTTGPRSSRHTTTSSRPSDTAHAASHDPAWAVPGERHPQTSATLTHSRLQSVLPYCPPTCK